MYQVHFQLLLSAPGGFTPSLTRQIVPGPFSDPWQIVDPTEKSKRQKFKSIEILKLKKNKLKKSNDVGLKKSK